VPVKTNRMIRLNMILRIKIKLVKCIKHFTSLIWLVYSYGIGAAFPDFFNLLTIPVFRFFIYTRGFNNIFPSDQGFKGNFSFLIGMDGFGPSLGAHDDYFPFFFSLPIIQYLDLYGFAQFWAQDCGFKMERK